MRLLPTLFACLTTLAASAAAEIGKPAPDFTAKDKDGKTVSWPISRARPSSLNGTTPAAPT